MTRQRTEFPESVKQYAAFSASDKRKAFERAGHRCQDPLCGVSAEWKALEIQVAPLGLTFTDHPWYAPLPLLEALRTVLLDSRVTHPRLVGPIIKRFKLDGGALLEVDHEREDADGGAATLENAIVRCVFCHLFKTQERARVRRKGPRKEPPKVHQLDVHDGIRMNTVSGLQALVDGVKVGCGVGDRPVKAADQSDRVPRSDPTPRRHTSEAAFQAALRKRQEAVENNPWGC